MTALYKPECNREGPKLYALLLRQPFEFSINFHVGSVGIAIRMFLAIDRLATEYDAVAGRIIRSHITSEKSSREIRKCRRMHRL